MNASSRVDTANHIQHKLSFHTLLYVWWHAHRNARRPSHRSSPYSAGLCWEVPGTAAVWSLSRYTQLPVKGNSAEKWLFLRHLTISVQLFSTDKTNLVHKKITCLWICTTSLWRLIMTETSDSATPVDYSVLDIQNATSYHVFLGFTIQSITYCRREFNAVVQITEPEEVSEAMCDVKWIELLISEVQKSQDVDVVLIASANTATFIARTSSEFRNYTAFYLIYICFYFNTSFFYFISKHVGFRIRVVDEEAQQQQQK